MVQELTSSKLSMVYIDGIDYPIIFLSQSFKAAQKRWSTADKECHAIVYAIKHLEHLI